MYDGEKIILYHEKQKRYIQIEEKKVSIAADKIEKLDSPDFVYDGHWKTPFKTLNEKSAAVIEQGSFISFFKDFL